MVGSYVVSPHFIPDWVATLTPPHPHRFSAMAIFGAMLDCEFSNLDSYLLLVAFIFSAALIALSLYLLVFVTSSRPYLLDPRPWAKSLVYVVVWMVCIATLPRCYGFAVWLLVDLYSG
jgi:hypothetical protein